MVKLLENNVIVVLRLFEGLVLNGVAAFQAKEALDVFMQRGDGGGLTNHLAAIANRFAYGREHSYLGWPGALALCSTSACLWRVTTPLSNSHLFAYSVIIP